MSNQIKVKRGLEANLPTLALGEFGYTTDSEILYIGGNNGNVVINKSDIVNIKRFGAKGDGVTDDTVAIQNAINSLSVGGIVLFPQGDYVISSTLIVNKPIKLVGEGRGDDSNNTNSSGLGVSRLKWQGASGGTMVSFVSATPNHYLFDCGVEKLSLNGFELAGIGIHAKSVTMSNFEDIHVRRCQEVGMIIDGGNGVLSGHNFINDYHYVWGADVSCENSHGLVLGNLLDQNTTQTHIGNMLTLTKNGNGLMFKGTDNNVVEKMQGVVQGTGYTVYFDGSGVSKARTNYIKYMAGSVYADENTFGNRIHHLISEGAKVVANGNSQIHYELEDYVNAELFKTHSYVMSDELEISLGEFNIVGVNAVNGLASSQWACIDFPDSGTSKIGVHKSIPYNWNDGDIETIKLFFTTDTANSNATFKSRITIGRTVDGASMVTPPFDTTVDIPVNNAQNNMNVYDLPVALTYTRGQGINISIERKADDVGDVVNGKVQILGALIVYKSKGANSPGSGTFDVTQPYV